MVFLDSLRISYSRGSTLVDYTTLLILHILFRIEIFIMYNAITVKHPFFGTGKFLVS